MALWFKDPGGGRRVGVDQKFGTLNLPPAIALGLPSASRVVVSSSSSQASVILPGGLSCSPFANRPNLERQEQERRYQERIKALKDAQKKGLTKAAPEHPRGKDAKVLREEESNKVQAERRDAWEQIHEKEDLESFLGGKKVSAKGSEKVPAHKLSLQISIPTAQRAQASAAGAKPKASMTAAFAPLVEARTTRQEEDNQLEDFENLQAKVKSQLEPREDRSVSRSKSEGQDRLDTLEANTSKDNNDSESEREDKHRKRSRSRDARREDDDEYSYDSDDDDRHHANDSDDQKAAKKTARR